MDDDEPLREGPLEADEGGTSACWANRVCPACGRLNEAEHPVVCEACGAAFDTDEQ